MAVSLESRVPLLDHEVVAFALSLPLSYKRSNGTGKIVLRKVLEKYVPREMIDRPKKGFFRAGGKWIARAVARLGGKSCSKNPARSTETFWMRRLSATNGRNISVADAIIRNCCGRY